VIETIFQGTLTAASQRDYDYFPFQVPPDAVRIEVAYEYEGRDGDTVLDIGLFGPGGTDFISGDWRGWSGSFRREFFVMADRATPGYVPGPLPAGEWHIVLGLQETKRPTATFRVVVRVYTQEPAAGWPNPAPTDVHERVTPAAAQLVAGLSTGSPRSRSGQAGQALRTANTGPHPRWYKGDLHLHSVHSDGENPIPDLVAAARARGLDFLTLTDHNTVAQNPHLPAASTADVLLIPGEEITSYYGHANVWGLDCWLDFRLRTPADAEALIAEAHRRGLLFSINHPKDGGPDWDWKAVRGFDCLEVWGALWWVSNYQALAWWDELLREGRRVVAVGGSDIHLVRTPERVYPHELGNPTTWVWAESFSQTAILDGIRRGHVFLTSEPAGVEIHLTAHTANGRDLMMGDKVPVAPGETIRLAGRVMGAEGCILRLVSDAGIVMERDIDAPSFAWERDVTVTRNTYYRVEAMAPPEVPLDEEPAALMIVALTNPVYVRIGNESRETRN